MALANDDSESLYVRVETPRVYGKFIVQFEVAQYIKHPVTSERMEVNREIMECDYDLAGGNIFEQCYMYAKGVITYATVDC